MLTDSRTIVGAAQVLASPPPCSREREGVLFGFVVGLDIGPCTIEGACHEHRLSGCRGAADKVHGQEQLTAIGAATAGGVIAFHQLATASPPSVSVRSSTAM